MNTSISGIHIQLDNTLKNYINERIEYLMQKYFGYAINTEVKISKQSYNFICDIISHNTDKKNIILKSNSNSDDIYHAFDSAIIKLEKQLRKYKSKIKNHYNRTKLTENNLQAVEYVITPDNYSDTEDSNEQDINSVIIAEKPIEIMSLSLNEAIMKLDLENLPALMFQNNKSKRINVIYCRKDGNISWVDSKE